MVTDQITGTVGGATGTPLAGITGTLQGKVGGLINKGQNILDRIIPPEQREEIKSKLARFSTERPLLASFLLSQIALSGLPLALFFIMTITVGVFALLTGVIVGLIGALLFVVAALVVALFILLPTLFITTFFAVALWLWGVGAYYIVKWFNEKKVPGVHVPLKEGLLDQTGLNKMIPALSGTNTNGHQPTQAEQNGSVTHTQTDTETDTKRDHKRDAASHKVSTDKKTDEHKTPKASSEVKHNGYAEDEPTPAQKHHHVKKADHKRSTAAVPTDTVADAGDLAGNISKQVAL